MFCGIPSKRREKGVEKLFKETKTQDFPYLIKNMNINIQDA